MNNAKSCKTNKVAMYIRVLLSLIVIGLGIYYRNWVGVLGLFTLYTAFTGSCGLGLSFGRKSDCKLDEPEE